MAIRVRVFPVALAYPGTVSPETILGADARSAIGTGPTVRTRTLAIGCVTGGPVQAAACLRTPDTVPILGTGIETLVAHKTRHTEALARHSITVSTVEAFAALGAPYAIVVGLAAIGTHRTGVAGRTNTLTRHGIARATVLAPTFGLTLGSMRSGWAAFRAAETKPRGKVPSI